MTTTMTKPVLEQARELQNEIVEMRRHLHMHPELSFQEHQTSKFVAHKLKDLGYNVTSNVGVTGVYGDLGTGKTVAIRADMDALPVQEEGNSPYKSTVPGVMHACGHDAHVSCALAAAKILARQELSGRIRMIMQPAEENVDEESKSGARKMIEDGVMDGVASVIGLHMDASIPAGKVAIQPGPVMAAADMFRIVLHGKGGHGAYPEATIDTVVLAAHVIQAVQQIVSRRIAASDAAVVTIGSVHSSSVRGNVVSDRVELLGTIRSFNEGIRKKLIDELNRACSIAKTLGGDFETEFELGYPSTVNDPAVTQILKESACALIGEENVITIPPKTWAEDFSMLAQVAPGAFMFLGCEIEGDRRAHHSPTFDINESSLYIGSAILADTARRLLAQK